MSDQEGRKPPGEEGVPEEPRAAAPEQEKAPPPAWEVDPKSPEWLDADQDALVEAVRSAHGELLHSARTFAGELVLGVRGEGIVAVCRELRDSHGFRLLVDICGAHYPKREEAPLEVVYHLHNLETRRRIRLKVEVAEGEEVPSVTRIYRGANWLEREAWDMFGVPFAGHPDMTRILMWEGFNGHPLRKEFPLEGVDTGSAIYPEYYQEQAGPVAGTGTGWKAPEPPAEESPPEPDEG